MSQTTPIKVGQVWVERSKRQEYPHKRELRVEAIGDTTITARGTDITEITFSIQKRWSTNQWERSSRTMYAFGLRKNWILEDENE